jgi:hypothetical protein
MSAVTGIIAGVVTAAGAVALFRLVERRARSLRTAIDEARGRRRANPVLDFEQDPSTGVFPRRSAANHGDHRDFLTAHGAERRIRRSAGAARPVAPPRPTGAAPPTSDSHGCRG